MNRVVVFAHFDANENIRDYVVYYLKELKKISSKIIFVSDGNIKANEKQKIVDICDYIEAKKHSEYDFGSYKRGYLYLKNNNMLDSIDELIFANDSCYAPMYPFTDMFNKMEKEKCDFWGITKNNFDIDGNRNEHLQSYFLAFKNNVFNSEIFFDFMNNVKPEEDKFDVVRKYEQGLSKLLSDNQYTYKFYAQDYNIKSPHILAWKELLINDKSPLLKANVIRLKEYRMAFPFNWEKLVKKYTNYPIELIFDDLKYNKSKKSPILLAYQNLRKKLLRIHPKTKTIYILGKEIKF